MERPQALLFFFARHRLRLGHNETQPFCTNTQCLAAVRCLQTKGEINKGVMRTERQITCMHACASEQVTRPGAVLS